MQNYQRKTKKLKETQSVSTIIIHSPLSITKAILFFCLKNKMRFVTLAQKEKFY